MICGTKIKQNQKQLSSSNEYFERNIEFNQILLESYEQKGNDKKLYDLPKKFFQVCYDEGK